MTFTEAEAHALSRVQFAMWLPARCAVCGDEYESVDDFIARNPRATATTPDPDTGFIDDACYYDGPSPKPHIVASPTEGTENERS